MELKSGQLYFINEQDVRTGEKSNYYKIGIVRDSENRDSLNRLLEHQTGNPRKLSVVERLEMPAVEYVETNLHYLFARKRVLGEWLELDHDELEKVIEKAQELKAQIEELLPDFENSKVLSKTLSNGITIPKDVESLGFYETLLEAREVSKRCDFLKAEYQKYLEAAWSNGVEVPVLQKQKRGPKKVFNEDLFKKSYPEIYQAYLQKDSKGSFRLVPAKKDWVSKADLIMPDQLRLLEEFEELLKTSNYSLDFVFNIHDPYLGVLEIKKFVEFQETIAGTKLRVLTGSNAGIEEICKWERVEVLTLNKAELKANHPAEYEACIDETEGGEANIIDPKAAMKNA